MYVDLAWVAHYLSADYGVDQTLASSRTPSISTISDGREVDHGSHSNMGDHHYSSLVGNSVVATLDSMAVYTRLITEPIVGFFFWSCHTT